MTETIASVTDTMERVLMPLGLMEGPYAIPKRMFLGGLIGAGIITWLKPSYMFGPDGTPRPFALLTNEKLSCGPEPTYFPWYAFAFLFAILLGGFI